MVLGTVAYMSPEQARANAVDARTDVFSLGVVFHEMLAGDPPFQRASVAETLSAILKEDPSPLPEDVTSLAPELPPILRKSLSKKPDDRYQRMREVAQAIREVRDRMGSGARPVFGLGLPKKVRTAGIGASGRPAIAVMYFEDNTGSEEIRWLSKGLPNMLLTDLARTPGLDVVSRQRIQELLKQVGEEDLDALDASLVPEIARRAGAGAVVGGSIYKIGDEIRIDVQVEDVGSGRILSAHSVRGDDVFPLVDELTGRIRASLNMADAPLERGIADVTTANLEAYRHYSEGLEAYRNFRWSDARAHLERAVEIDPSFALAYFRLSQLSGLWADETVQEGYRQKVRDHLDRMPERRRLFVEASFAQQQDDDPEQAKELLEELLTRYPDEEDAYTLLSVIYNGPLNERPKAIETLARGTVAVPTSGTIRNQLGYYFLYDGRYPEAFRELEAYADLNPHEPNPFDSMGEAYLFTGQPDKALASYGQALEVDPSFFNANTGRAWAFAMLGRYDEARDETLNVQKTIDEAGFQNLEPTTMFVSAFLASRVGRYQEAEEQISLGIDLAQKLDQTGVVVPLHLLSAAMALEREDYSRVVELANEAQRFLPELESEEQRKAQSIFADLLAGTAEARTGDIEAARARLGSQRELYDPERELLNWAYHALEGEIALTAGELEEAAAALTAGEPEIKMHLHMTAAIVSLAANNPPLRDGMARVKKAQGDLAGAIAIYRGLWRPNISAKWTAMLEPRFVLELARLLEESGDTAAARDEYERFLSLWKNADPELPELQEAREYLASDHTQTS